MTAEQVAAFLVLWFALACIGAPFVGAWLRASAREMPPAPGDQPPPGMVPAPGPDEETRP